jgi:hypothetical protein
LLRISLGLIISYQVLSIFTDFAFFHALTNQFENQEAIDGKWSDNFKLGAISDEFVSLRGYRNFPLPVAALFMNGPSDKSLISSLPIPAQDTARTNLTVAFDPNRFYCRDVQEQLDSLNDSQLKFTLDPKDSRPEFQQLLWCMFLTETLAEPKEISKAVRQTLIQLSQPPSLMNDQDPPVIIKMHKRLLARSLYSRNYQSVIN